MRAPSAELSCSAYLAPDTTRACEHDVRPEPMFAHLDMGCGVPRPAMLAAGSEYTATDTGGDDDGTVAVMIHVPVDGAVYSSQTLLATNGSKSSPRNDVGGVGFFSPASVVASAVTTFDEPDAPLMAVRAAKLSLPGRAVQQDMPAALSDSCFTMYMTLSTHLLHSMTASSTPTLTTRCSPPGWRAPDPPSPPR